MTNLDTDGYSIHRKVISEDSINALREEVNRVSDECGQQCIRGLLERSALIGKLAGSSRMKQLIPEGYEVVRSILFDKTPEQNWPVAWHQDQTIAVRDREEVEGYEAWTNKSGFHQVRPPLQFLKAMVTLRIHLDDTGPGNGALRVIPGSHLNFINSGTISFENREIVECGCDAGDVLAMKPLVLHSSPRSTSPCHRRVIHLEYADRSCLPPQLEWAESIRENGRQPAEVA